MHNGVKKRLPVAFFYFNGWDSIQLGISLCWSQPNIEIHVPFGFFRIGWTADFDSEYLKRKSEKPYFLLGYENGWHCHKV